MKHATGNPILKINFVSHLHPFYYHGGGEQVTKKIVEEGIKRGHNIKIISMKPSRLQIFSQILMHRNPELWILFDVFNCPDHKRHFSRRFINKIILSRKYVIGQNGYGDICYLNALPCNGNIGNGSVCVEKKDIYFNYRDNEKGWQNGYCPVNDNRDLFEKALLNIFVSPLHASIFHKIYPATREKTYILKPLIDVDMFTNRKQNRDIKYAACGGMGEAKGFYNIRDDFLNEEVILFGSDSKLLPDKHNYGKVIGRIPYEKMPEFLNRVENYIHLPRWPEPHGLIVNQAALCGCKLITNENVGAVTHDFDIMDRKAYKDTAPELWKRIEELANCLKGK